ncbi:MAG: hypothetical protein A3H96_21260 [Acidobacteria bacterium RIFCSPLOWO2_02_FULL_67_36]|nr:MAG: hypothetical protein A3H96_21260 [Acidobacteria bacterium RIFCSPLOWO2_02_FULL_67_36]OFW21958.1 MAG: hypothetical protein A3G21_08835 [Acidobacteria bacterium RIFCSPLOWO2_12_FULL_66_21]
MRLRPILALVLLAALCTPLPALHVHPAHDADHRALLHAHFGVHTGANLPASSLAEHEADATYVDDVASVRSPAGLAVHPIAVSVDWPSVTASSSVTCDWRDHPDRSVHDPPVASFGLRAPPAVLA